MDREIGPPLVIKSLRPFRVFPRVVCRMKSIASHISTVMLNTSERKVVVLAVSSPFFLRRHRVKLVAKGIIVPCNRAYGNSSCSASGSDDRGSRRLSWNVAGRQSLPAIVSNSPRKYKLL